MEHFEGDPWLGTLSGKLHVRFGDRLVRERTGDENSVGPAKFYRVGCFRSIGGFVREVCWDGIDGHMCRMKGWVARSIDERELAIVHLRQMGSSHVNIWTGRTRWGRGKYFMGSTPYYMAAVCLYRMVERPYVLGGLGILWGYAKAALDGNKRITDEEYLAFVRQFERDSLIFGKRGAVDRYDEKLRERPPPASIAVSERDRSG